MTRTMREWRSSAPVLDVFARPVCGRRERRDGTLRILITGDDGRGDEHDHAGEETAHAGRCPSGAVACW